MQAALFAATNPIVEPRSNAGVVLMLTGIVMSLVVLTIFAVGALHATTAENAPAARLLRNVACAFGAVIALSGTTGGAAMDSHAWKT